MKLIPGYLVLLLWSVLSLAAKSYEVSASQAIRIAIIDTDAEQAGVELAEVFGACFARNVALIYGAETPVSFEPVSPEVAADRLRRGTYDAALVFSPRLPSAIRRSGCHAVRAVASTERNAGVAYLVLRREQPKLDVLLANAFNAAVNDEAVRRVLTDRRQTLLLAQR